MALADDIKDVPKAVVVEPLGTIVAHFDNRLCLRPKPEPVLLGPTRTLTGFLIVLTAVWHDWVEGIFGFDPDHHNGSFEWELVIACALVTVVCSLLARREWRHATFAVEGTKSAA